MNWKYIEVINFNYIAILKTIYRPWKGRRCIPDVVILVHVETYLNDFSSLAQVKKQVEIQFRTFLKKIQFFGFQCCSTREDLSIDVSITNVGLILTKLSWFLFSRYGQTDRVLESSHGKMSTHKKFQLKIIG